MRPDPQTDTAARLRADPADPRRRVLLVGPGLTPPPAGPRGGDIVVHARFAHLSARLIARVCPDLVVAPLLTPQWDVLDLAAVLVAGGYAGSLEVQSQPLPRADLVLGEVRALFPRLAINLSHGAAPLPGPARHGP